MYCPRWEMWYDTDFMYGLWWGVQRNIVLCTVYDGECSVIQIICTACSGNCSTVQILCTESGEGYDVDKVFCSAYGGHSGEVQVV